MFDPCETETYNEVKRLVDELATLDTTTRQIEAQKETLVSVLAQQKQKLLEEAIGDSSILNEDWLKLLDITNTTSRKTFRLSSSIKLDSSLSGWQLWVVGVNDSVYLGLVRTRHALAKFLLALPKEF